MTSLTFLFVLLLHKTCRSHAAVRLFSNRSQIIRQIMVRTSSDTLSHRLVCHIFFVLLSVAWSDSPPGGRLVQYYASIKFACIHFVYLAGERHCTSVMAGDTTQCSPARARTLATGTGEVSLTGSTPLHQDVRI